MDNQTALEKRVFTVLFSAMAISMTGTGFGPLMGIYARELGAAGFMLGVFASSFPAARTLSQPFVGHLSDRGYKKFFIAAGILIFVLVSFGYKLAGSPMLLVLMRFIHGIATAMVMPVAIAYIGEMTPKGREGAYTSIFNISFMIGWGVGPMLAGFLWEPEDLLRGVRSFLEFSSPLVPHLVGKLTMLVATVEESTQGWGIHTVFTGMALMTSVAFALIVFFLPSDRRFMASRNGNGENQPSPAFPLRILLKDNTALGLLVWSLVHSIGRGASLFFISVFAKEVANVSAFGTGVIISLYTLVPIFFYGSIGRLADRMSRVKLIVLGTIGRAALYSLLPLTVTFMPLLGLCILIGVIEAFSAIASTALSVDLGRQYGMGSVQGAFQTAQSLGMLAAGPVNGIIFQAFSINLVFFNGSFMELVSIVSLLIFIKMSGEARWQRRSEKVAASSESTGDEG
ncbi:MAG: MFS transporter [Candidatus Tectomicrobia bacterium]|nr:MFS transporter [Candidatus Tectomicrobia bacterium]